MLKMPNREGWTIEWIKEWRNVTRRSGRIDHVVFYDSFTSQSKDSVLRRKAELEANGIQVKGPMECLF